LGGAERVLVDVSNELCKNYDVTIFSIYDNGELKSDLDNEIKFISLYDKRYDQLTKVQKIWVPLKILLFKSLLYKKYLKSGYDVEIAFLEGPITRLFSCKNKTTKKIAWIHNDISQVFGKSIKSKIKSYIDSKTYKKYNDLVFVSKDNLEKFSNMYPDIDLQKMHVIYNYINKDSVIKKSKENFNNPFEDEVNLVSVCRLVKQKAIDRFIKVHSKLIKLGINHKVYIIGEGPEKPYLINLIEKENVQDSFVLLGKKENPYPYIKYSNFFCLLSEFEGYGMVLEEAKILEKPIIITNTAAREALEHYNNSIILENSEEAIFNGLKNIIRDNKQFGPTGDNYYDNKIYIEKIKQLIEK
jgi:glycosyltransferase involved in cell wall biosynthesis